MDIWLQNEKVPSPVPIELKVLDKGWSGPGLCKGLRDQLAGDYLRETTGGYGLMLMVWQGKRAWSTPEDRRSAGRHSRPLRSTQGILGDHLQLLSQRGGS